MLYLMFDVDSSAEEHLMFMDNHGINLMWHQYHLTAVYLYNKQEINTVTLCVGVRVIWGSCGQLYWEQYAGGEEIVLIALRTQ